MMRKVSFLCMGERVVVCGANNNGKTDMRKEQ